MPARRHSILWPLLLIAVGVAFLLDNLGWLPAGWWREMWRLWPLILVFIGLEIVFGRGHPLAALVIVAVFIAIVGAALWHAQPTARRVWTDVLPVQERLDGIAQAEFDLEFGLGALSVAALAAPSDYLVVGEVAVGSDVSLRRRDGSATLRLRPPSERFWKSGDWRLNLSPQPATDLSLRAGAAELDLDLRELNLRRLSLQLGATSATVRLPAVESATVAVDAAASSVRLDIPADVAARIRPTIAVADLAVDEGRFPRSGDWYVSPGFDTAERRLEVTLRGAASSITVK